MANSCFISTLSALGIPGTDYFRKPDLSQRKFQHVMYSEAGNLTHVALTPKLADFVIKYVAF